jgi:colicin import membrane protein
MTFRGRRIDPGLVFSVIAHFAVLLWAAVSFAAKPPDTMPTDSIFVETMSLSDFSEMTKGSKTAPKVVETPKPLVEKVAETKPPPEDVTAKVDEKQEVKTASAAPDDEAPPEVKPPEPKPKPVEAKPEPKKEPEKKPEAEALKKDEKKVEKPKKEEAKVVPKPPKKPDPPKKQAEKKPPRHEQKFDADRIAALLDKRQPQRVAAAGDTLNSTASLGTQSGFAAQLSQNEIDALRARIQQCWNPPAGAADAKDLVVLLRIRFNQDGSLAGQPAVVNRGSGTYFQVAAESALRAVVRCAPYTFLPVAKYDAWKDVEVTFDPRDLFRG